MANWARRMHRRAATIGNVVTSCGHANVPPYPRRIEKVKFGVPLEQVCKNDIPGPLLVLILKLNKEAPFKKDTFRAPGHQGSMKKLIHFLQNGRLVNIDNFSTHTIASVLKKFLRKLPGGIFGAEREEQLFTIIDLEDSREQRHEIHSLITSMPIYAQHLLVLLFGTFRAIATHAERAQTGMSAETLAVSVAPSFFHSCVSDGKQAKMEDVIRFKVATKIMQFLIDNFGASNLFGRENYEYYARITGRVLKVEDEWIFSFRYPPDTMVPPLSSQEESHSTPALIHIPEESDSIDNGTHSSLTLIPENRLRESCTRLSISLEENGLYKRTSSSTSSSSNGHRLTLEELKAINRYAESTKSLSYLPQVHERQTARMRTRSEWFLSGSCVEGMSSSMMVVPIEFEDATKILQGENSSRALGGAQAIPSTPSVGHPPLYAMSEPSKQLVRRTSSKEKRLVRRSSSKKDKENGNKAYSMEALHSVDISVGSVSTSALPSSPHRSSVPASGSVGVTSSPIPRTQSVRSVTEQEFVDLEAQTLHMTLTYKPRI